MDDLLPFLANAQEHIITELNMDKTTQAQLQGHRLDIDRRIALSILVERCTWAITEESVTTRSVRREVSGGALVERCSWAGVDLCAQELASAAL